MSIIQITASLKTHVYSHEHSWCFGTAVWKARWDVEWAAETAGLLGGPRRHCSSDGNTKPKRVPISLPLNIAIQLAWSLQTQVASHFLANGLRLDYPFQGLDIAALSGETKDTRRRNQGAFHASNFQMLLLQITTALSPAFRCLNSDTPPPTRTKLWMKTSRGRCVLFTAFSILQKYLIGTSGGKKEKG